jgi:hypothetical protein
MVSTDVHASRAAARIAERCGDLLLLTTGGGGGGGGGRAGGVGMGMGMSGMGGGAGGSMRALVEESVQYGGSETYRAEARAWLDAHPAVPGGRP